MHCGSRWVRQRRSDATVCFNISYRWRCMLIIDSATHGTTKYCSAYLRNDTCPNKNCMFLHEPGEEAESFSRMELSTANSRQTKEQAASQLPAPPRAPVAAA